MLDEVIFYSLCFANFPPSGGERKLRFTWSLILNPFINSVFEPATSPCLPGSLFVYPRSKTYAVAQVAIILTTICKLKAVHICLTLFLTFFIGICLGLNGFADIIPIIKSIRNYVFDEFMIQLGED
jgi:hypothetical protein